jgi:putative CocE/NonD family hydrolase
MNKSAEAPRPKKKLVWRIFKVLLWIIGGLLALILVLIAALAASTSFREWTTTRLLSDYIVRDRLAGVPQRSEPLPVQRLMVRMRDGVELSTQVFLPKGAGPWPVIVVRDPYSFSQYLSCTIFVRYGYGCVYQEVRGRGPSQGTWYPFVDERKDGLDLIAWILKQPWQNGKLALQGGSYVGVVQWAVAGDMPPEVKTFVPTVSNGDVYELAYRNGAFNEGIAGIWLHSQGRSIIGTVTAGSEWLKNVAAKFPAQAVPSSEFALGWKAYQDYIKHPDKDDAYWQSPEYVALREAHRKVQVPVFMIGFANDFFLPGMLRTYEELPTRDKSLLVIGPGNHGGQKDPEVQGSYKGDYTDTLAWLDHHLRGEPLPERLRPGVNVFVHGVDSWQHFGRWPAATTQPRSRRPAMSTIHASRSRPAAAHFSC